MDIIQLDHISKRFAHKILFDDVILRVSEGSIVGFKGANGCGKSVLFKIISGLYRPDSGDVYVRGKKIGDDFDYPPDMGIFINAPGFIPVYSGFKNLKCLADIRGKIDSKKICATMDKVGLNPNVLHKLSWKIKVYCFWTNLSTPWTKSLIFICWTV